MWEAPVGLYCIYSNETGSAAATKLIKSGLLEEVFNFITIFLIISYIILSSVPLITSYIRILLSFHGYV